VSILSKESGHHQSSQSGSFFTSGRASDPSNPGGSFISTGNKDGHTTQTYDSQGRHVETHSSGDGGPARDVPAGGKK